MKPLGKVKIEWSPDFAYAIGLIVSDGNLSPDGRHVIFTSKDEELVNKFQKSLQIKLHIGRKSRGGNIEKKYYVVQIGDVSFYKFLLGIGLMPKKSKIIRDVKVPDEYFFDFLRGSFDGDGSFFSYWDKRWHSSFMFYLSLLSASRVHVLWLREEIACRLHIHGHISISQKPQNAPVYILRYAKKEALRLLPELYYNNEVVCLSRKIDKIRQAITLDMRECRNW